MPTHNNAKVMKISEITATFEFSEFSYVKSHLAGFQMNKLGVLKSLLPIEELVKFFTPPRRTNNVGGRPEVLHLEAQICLMFLKSLTGLSDAELISRLNTDIYYQLFCNFIVSPLSPLRDFKILSRIRTRLSRKLDIMEFQKIIANSLKPHISANDLKTLVSDATCYESNLRFPTNQKLLMECIDWLYSTIHNIKDMLNIRMPRTKYNDVKLAYQLFSKRRKKSCKQKRTITRRLLHLHEKLVNELSLIKGKYKLVFDSRLSATYSLTKKVLEQQQSLFAGDKIEGRIVSIFKPYIRPIVRGKEIKEVEFGAKVNAIQVGGFNFIEHLNFNAFHEGIRVPECVLLHKILFHVKPRFFAGDAIYATNANRTFCKGNNMITNFPPKGRRPKNDEILKRIRKDLNVLRSTTLEGSFGVEKNNYSLSKVKARTKENEILWILFGIHTANFSRLANRIIELQKTIKTAA